MKRTSMDEEFHRMLKVEAAKRGISMQELQRMLAMQGTLNFSDVKDIHDGKKKGKGDYDFGFL